MDSKPLVNSEDSVPTRLIDDEIAKYKQVIAGLTISDPNFKREIEEWNRAMNAISALERLKKLNKGNR